MALVYGIRNLRILALFSLCFAWAMRIYLIHTEVKHPGIWCNSIARIDPIAAGILISVLLNHRIAKISTLLRIILFSGGLLSYFVAIYYGWFDGDSVLWVYPAVTIGSVMFFFSFFGLSEHWMKNKFAQFCAYGGKISYGIYVYHIVVIKLVYKLEFSCLCTLLLSFLITIAIAFVSYRIIELPVLKLKARFSTVHH